MWGCILCMWLYTHVQDGLCMKESLSWDRGEWCNKQDYCSIVKAVLLSFYPCLDQLHVHDQELSLVMARHNNILAYTSIGDVVSALHVPVN